LTLELLSLVATHSFWVPRIFSRVGGGLTKEHLVYFSKADHFPCFWSRFPFHPPLLKGHMDGAPFWSWTKYLGWALLSVLTRPPPMISAGTTTAPPFLTKYAVAPAKTPGPYPNLFGVGAPHWSNPTTTVSVVVVVALSLFWSGFYPSPASSYDVLLGENLGFFFLLF